MTEREKALADVTLDLIDVAKAHRGRALMPGVIDGLIERATDALALPAGAASPPGGGTPPRDMREALRQNPGLAERIVKSAIIDGELAKKTNDEIADLLLEHVWADVETFTAKAGLLEIAIERLRAGGFAAGWKAALEQGAGLVDHDENIPAAFAARLRALAAAPPPPGTAPRTKE